MSALICASIPTYDMWHRYKWVSFMGRSIYRAVDRSQLTRLVVWLFSTWVPLLTLSTMRSYTIACNRRLAYLATSTLGWPGLIPWRPLIICAWSIGPLCPNWSLPPMAFHRVRCLAHFSKSFTRLIFFLLTTHDVLGLPMMCWISCTLMISRPTCTVWHLTP